MPSNEEARRKLENLLYSAELRQKAQMLAGTYQDPISQYMDDLGRGLMEQKLNTLNPNATYTVGDVLPTALNMTPILGDALAVEQATKDIKQDRYGSAAFNIATALPGIGDAAALAKVGLPTLFAGGYLARQMAKRSGDVPVTPFARMQGVVGGSKLRLGRLIPVEAKNLDDIGDIKVAYRGGHTAPVDPEYHAPLYEMNRTYPDDIYSPQAERYYGHGDHALDAESFEIINKVRGKPDAEVTIYRAVPIEASDEILPGDWVTINKKYARQHGQGLEKYKILKAKVKAKQLRTDGNSPHEFGFTGEK